MDKHCAGIAFIRPSEKTKFHCIPCNVSRKRGHNWPVQLTDLWIKGEANLNKYMAPSSNARPDYFTEFPLFGAR